MAAASEQLWRPLHGKFPDSSGVAPKLVRKISEHLANQIESSIIEAENERSFLQWAFRFDVENTIQVKVSTSLCCGYNSAIANVEGCAEMKRKKGECFSMLSSDTVIVKMDLVIKALFLNGGQLSEINNDPHFIDRVQAGENKFAVSFVHL